MEIDAVYGLGGTRMTLNERFTLISQLAAAQAEEEALAARQRVQLWKLLQQQEFRINNRNNINPPLAQRQNWVNKPGPRSLQRNRIQQNMGYANGLPRNAFPRNGLPRNGYPLNGVPRNGVPRNGVPRNGVPRNGVPRNGVPRNRLPRNGAQSKFHRNNVQNRLWQRRPWTAPATGAQKRRLAAAMQRRRIQTFRARRNAMGGFKQRNRTNITREQLDRELEQYMNCTKSALDQQLEAYMADAI